MKILLISPSNTFPAISGGAVRTNTFLKYLAKENEIFYVYNKYHQAKEVREGKIKFNIKSKTKISNVKLYSVGPSIRAAQLFNPFLLIKSYKIIKKQKIDLVIGEFAWSGIYLLLLKLLTNIPYIIDEHEIESELVEFNYGLIGKLISPIVRLYEELTWKFSKYIFCVSENDKKMMLGLGPCNKKIVFVPHGIDSNLLKKTNKKKIRKKLKLNPNDLIVLFFGKLDYSPNNEAVDMIHKEILPRILKMSEMQSISEHTRKSKIQENHRFSVSLGNSKNFKEISDEPKVFDKRKNMKFLIVGSNPPNLKHENIIFTGPVENIKNYIGASDIVINPLLNGAGVRFKILESIACGKTVISTSIGAGELANENLKDFLIIKNDWDGFSGGVIENLSKKDRRPPKEFLERYSWKEIINKVNILLQDDK